MNGSSYLLDANVFIEAARHYYAFDLAPRFWNSLLEHAAKGRVLSVDRVMEELERCGDELEEWARTRFFGAFARTDVDDVIDTYRQVMVWVQSREQFWDAAKAEFARGADGWLVAYARARGCILVTHEALAPDAKNRVPIPNVCQAFSVRWVNTFSMLRALGVRFS